jgi:hypothetical protein
MLLKLDNSSSQLELVNIRLYYKAGISHLPICSSTLTTIKTILKEESARSFWKGTEPTLFRVIPGAGS